MNLFYLLQLTHCLAGSRDDLPTLHRRLYCLPREGVEPSYKTMRYFFLFILSLSPLLAYLFLFFAVTTIGVFFVFFIWRSRTSTVQNVEG